MWFNAPIPRFGHRRPRSRLHALPMKFPSELDWAAMTIARYMLFRERHIYLTAISGTLRLQFCFILYRRVRIRPARAEVTYKFLDVMYVPDIAPSQVVRFNVSLCISRVQTDTNVSHSLEQDRDIQGASKICKSSSVTFRAACLWSCLPSMRISALLNGGNVN